LISIKIRPHQVENRIERKLFLDKINNWLSAMETRTRQWRKCWKK